MVRILLAFLLFDFTALSFYALSQVGLSGFVDAVFANVATMTLFADLMIALGLVLVWIWQDAREHGRSALPFTILTLALGSVGPLLYLVLRRDREGAAAPHLAPATTR